MTTEILARVQFTFTVMFHYIYPPMSIGIGAMLVIMEASWLRTGNILYHNMARFWTKIFGLTFAIGVATGIVMEFEFGTNWATYSRFVGDIFGSALAAEGIFAFFLESGFLALLLFGWDKVGPKLHFFATCMVCFGAHFSAVWIVVANSFMQTPAGYHLEKLVNGQPVRLPGDYILQPADLGTVRAVVDDFWVMLFNHSTLDRLSHVILGAWMTGAFLVISISAYYLLRGRHIEFAKSSMRFGLVFALIATLLQMVSGDRTATGVLKNQPIKLAALEGVYVTAPYTPMTLFGWVDAKSETVHGPKIPGLLSFLCFHDFQKPVPGLLSLPDDTFLRARHPGASSAQLVEIRKSYWPNVPFVFQVYHLMIAIGSALLGLILVAVFFWWRKWLFRTDWWPSRALLAVLVVSVLGPQIANQAGWFTAELGRQPWIVYELLRTSEALSKVVTANQIVFSMILFLSVYTLLFLVFIYLLNKKIHDGPMHGEESHEMPESWKAWLRKGPREFDVAGD